MEDGGYGKSARSRRHRAGGKAQTPYARPPPTRKGEPAGENAAGELALVAPRGSLLGSVFSAASTPFRAAASLINKVRRTRPALPPPRGVSLLRSALGRCLSCCPGTDSSLPPPAHRSRS